MNGHNKIAALAVSFLVLALISSACPLSSSPSKNSWWETQTDCLAPDFGNVFSDTAVGQSTAARFRILIFRAVPNTTLPLA